MLLCDLVAQGSNGVHQGGQVYEMGHGLGVGRLGLRRELNVTLAVVQHGRAADRVEGDGQDGVVQLQLALRGAQVAHGHGLQVGELGASGRGDGGDGDVGEPHGAGRGRDVWVAEGHHHLRRNTEVTSAL